MVGSSMQRVRVFLIRLSIIGPPALIVACALTMAYKEFSARRDVVDYLKLAADAPTLPLAERYLSTAVRNMEARRWTSGSTALIFKVPLRDLGFWYQNTKGARRDRNADRHRCKSHACGPLERTRETTRNADGRKPLDVSRVGRARAL